MKELPEEGGAGLGHDVGDGVDAVVETFVGADCVEGVDGAGLGVGGGVDEAAEACVDDGACAHGAGFEGDDECAVVESPVGDGFGGIADGEEFGVAEGIAERFAGVVGFGEEFAGVGFVDDGGDGGFAE